MSEPRKGRGEATRAAILGAAEAAFAEHGFDGARVDAIALDSGCNKTLIFRYFGDKTGLYIEVLKRVDHEVSLLHARSFTPLLEDGTIMLDAQRFTLFLKTLIEGFFDYYVEHPRIMRIVHWEQANGWQNLTRIASQFELSDLAQLNALFASARSAGFLRSDLDVVTMMLLIQQTCWSFPALFPLYQQFFAGRDLAPVSTLAYMREQIVTFLVTGIMGNSGS